MSTNTSSTPTSYGRPGSLGTSPATRRPVSHPREPPPAYTPPPPAYTEAANTLATTTTTTTTTTTSEGSDDKYSFLGQFDTIFLIDDSGSMAGRGWRETSKALEQITPICTKWDADGVDIWFLNAPQQDHFSNVRSAEQVQRIFREQKPYGGTPTGTRLNQILRPYLRDLEAKGAANVKPLNIIVITDGEPSDDPEGVIIFTANKLEKLEAPSWQVGIQFFQVGNAPDATQALQDLDDGLVGNNCARDIVDTIKFNPDGVANAELDGGSILKVVLGSVNRRLDRRNN